MNKYIASAAAAAVVVAPVAAIPTEAASTTGAAVTTDINGLAAQAAATQAFYDKVALVRSDYNKLSSTQKSKVTAATLTKLTNSEKAVQVMKDIQALNLNDAALESKTAAIRTAYTAIPLAGKLQVKNLADLVAAEEKAVANKTNAAAAAKVTTQINALGATPQELAVKNARTAYTALTDDQKVFVTAETVTKLTTAESYITAQKELADTAVTKASTYISKVNAIKDAANRTTALSEAEAAYLTTAELAVLTTAKATEVADAKKVFDNYNAAQVIIDKIDALLLTDDFAAYETAVKEARELYTQLPLAQKLLINNLADLVEEEKTVALGEEKAQETKNPDAVAAKKVSDLITALPAVGTETVTDEAKVLAANTEFNKLTPEAKALVADELKTKLTDLVNSSVFSTSHDAAAFEVKVAAIKDKTASNVEAAITALKTEYGNLDAPVKTAVDTAGNYAKVLTAEGIITEIKTAVAGVTAGSEKDATDAALTALLTAKANLDKLDTDTQAYVRNSGAITQKITATEGALRTNAKTEIDAIKTDAQAANATSTNLQTAITDAKAAVKKLAVISGVADFDAADDATKLTVTSKLTIYSEIGNAEKALEVVKAIEGITVFTPATPNFDAAITSNKTLRTAFDKLVAKEKAYVMNEQALKDNEKAVTDKLAALKTAANEAIAALLTETTQAGLDGKATAATTAASEYTAPYILLNGGDQAAADATLTNFGDIALAKAVNTLLIEADKLTYAYTTGDVDKAALTTAIGAYNLVKAAVTEALSTNKFFVKIGQPKVTAAATAIENSIDKLAADADTEITKLKTPAPTTVAAFEGFITTSKAAVTAFETPYKAYKAVTEADFTKVTKYADIKNAEDALATIKLYDVLAYAKPADVAAYSATTFTKAVTDLAAAKESFGKLTEAQQGFVFATAKDKATAQQTAITDTVALLLTNTTDKIAAITKANAATATAMTTVINAAQAAYDLYEVAYKAENGADSNATTTVSTYANIGYAKDAQVIMAAFDALSYTTETAAAYNGTTFAAATTAYLNAKKSYDDAKTEVQNFVFNKDTKLDTTKTALEGTVTNLKAESAAKNGAIKTAADAADATVATVEPTIETAETAYTTYETAFKKLNGDTATVDAVTDYANIANAEAALIVVKQIVEGLTKTDVADTIRKQERLEALNTINTTFTALDAAVKAFVFNKTALTDAITELNPAFSDRVALLDAAETAVKALQDNKDAAQVAALVTAAEEKVALYVAKTIPNTAAPAATDVVGQADIALYKDAAPTITAIAGITAAADADKEAQVDTARGLYDALAPTVQAKVFNYAVLTEAEGVITKAAADAKKAAADAIAALKDKKTVAELNTQIITAEQAVAAYKALNTSFSEYDIAGIEELEYAQQAVPVVDAIAGLTATSTKEAVADVRAEFGALSAKIQAYVVNLSVLKDLEDKFTEAEEEAKKDKEDQESEVAVTNFETKFNAITNATAATFEATVTVADEAYTALTADQKAAVTIVDADKKLANYKAAAPIVTAINAIGDTTGLTTADITALEEKVTSARSSYTAIPLAAKILVINLADLTAAEEKLAALKAEKATADKANADQVIAQVVIDQIVALDAMDIDSAAYVKAVKDARAAYKALALKHKLLVTNLADLVSHEQNI